jgi:hypothetical protein
VLRERSNYYAKLLNMHSARTAYPSLLQQSQRLLENITLLRSSIRLPLQPQFDDFKPVPIALHPSNISPSMCGHISFRAMLELQTRSDTLQCIKIAKDEALAVDVV